MAAVIILPLFLGAFFVFHSRRLALVPAGYTGRELDAPLWGVKF